MPKNFSAYKGTARSPQVRRKICGGESLREVLKILCYGFHSRVCSRCNITTVSGQKKAIEADWSGLERTGADIGTEAFYPVVYCGRIDYSGNCANRKISIGSDGYPNL